MENIKSKFKNLSKIYNSKKTEYATGCRELIAQSLSKLNTCEYMYYGDFHGSPRVKYYVYKYGNELSRPVRADIYINDPAKFEKEYSDLIRSFATPPSEWGTAEKERANNVVYTAVTAIACCYDIWQRSSRKTPGTFFEIFMSSLLKEYLSEYYFSKHIPLTEMGSITELPDSIGEEITESVNAEEDLEEHSSGDTDTSVATDLVITNALNNRGLVVPLKITTRERIVQPFAHQRILDSAFGPGFFTSYIACISETQLDLKRGRVNQICVPGTVKLFQKYLAPIGGIYYCDAPQRYMGADMKNIIPVKTMGDFFVDAYDFFRN